MDRKHVGTSHDGRYTYWLDADRYVYQRDERESKWKGWLCHLSAWENTFSKSTWMTCA